MRAPTRAAILPYAVLPAIYVEYEPGVVPAAAHAAALIESAVPWIHVEHIGSTAVPGCAGKGIIDLMAIYPPGKLAEARAAIDALGFQRQQAGHVFPEDRPMRVGAIEDAGKTYRLHLHVIAADVAEAVDLRRFRDALRADPALRDAYQAKKRAILESGLNEPARYTKAKGKFINTVLADHDRH